MDTDVRLKDAERARARYDSNVAGLDSMFEQAMAMKKKSYRKLRTCPRFNPCELCSARSRARSRLSSATAARTRT